MRCMTIEFAAIRLTETILGYNKHPLEQTLESIATDAGLRHISYLRFVAHLDARLLDTIVTYSMQWQQRYAQEQYVLIDPVIYYGSKAVLPFDWEVLMVNDPVILGFFADARNHDVGHNGISIPVRNRSGASSLISFTSDHLREQWVEYKEGNLSKLQLVASLIDSAASLTGISSPIPVGLSKREEQCLTLAAQGRKHDDIAKDLNIHSSQVSLYLDTARHKLNCFDLRHAIAVAIATEMIPAIATKALENFC